MKKILLLIPLLILATDLPAQTAPKKAKPRAGKIGTPAPTKPPLQPVDMSRLPDGTKRLDLFLLLGQSNMKGRGTMPTEPKKDPRFFMMHIKDDQWYLARHPLHLTGDAKTFVGHDNAGVGPGLSFAEAVAAEDAKLAIGLIPCAVGGSSIRLWQRGAKLYDDALRRAKLAIQTTTLVKARICGAVWLQGEADAKPAARADHAALIKQMISDLRADLGQSDLPFIGCTIGEMGNPDSLPDKQAMNHILLGLPQLVPGTACVDARDLKTHIGDSVHFDTAAQEEIGRRFAKLYLGLVRP